MGAVAQHDYIARVQEEQSTLAAELAEVGLAERIATIGQQLGLNEQLALAAVFRASRRSGLSLTLMVNELTAQLERASRPGA
jgi:hypothetical protein